MPTVAGPPPDEATTGGGHLAVFRRRRWVIIVCIVLAVAASVAASLLQTKEYTATSSLLFRDPNQDQLLLGDVLPTRSTDPQRETATNVRLVSLEVVAVRTAQRLGIPLSRVTSSTEVQAEGSSDVITVSATDEDPEFAARMANTLARQFVKFQRENEQAIIRRALTLIERRAAALRASGATAEARVLEGRVVQLGSLEELQTGNAELVQRAVIPKSPSSPKPIRNALAALFLGALAGLFLAVVRDRTDRRLRSREEIEELIQAPVLGQIPEDRSLSDATTVAPSAAALEAVHLLRANLRYFNVKERLNSLAVTSAASKEGKTTLSWALAVAACHAGHRVLLIEADLRRPTLSTTLRLGPSAGLTGVLTGEASLEDATLEIPIEQPIAGGNVGVSQLHIIPAGALPPNPTDLLESSAMIDLLRQTEGMYELVILDTAPVGSVADAIPLLREVSGTLVVARLGISERTSMARLRDTLTIVGVPVLGLVINSVKLDADYSSYAARSR